MQELKPLRHMESIQLHYIPLNTADAGLDAEADPEARAGDAGAADTEPEDTADAGLDAETDPEAGAADAEPEDTADYKVFMLYQTYNVSFKIVFFFILLNKIKI